jgi:hypothetical protein
MLRYGFAAVAASRDSPFLRGDAASSGTARSARPHQP